MDVNIAAVGVLVGRFHPVQPQDAAYDGISARSVWLDDLTGGTTAFKNRAGRDIATDFFGNLHAPERGAIAARFITDAKF